MRFINEPLAYSLDKCPISVLVSCVSAALRLGSLGHRQAQALLLSPRPRLSALVNMVWERELEELGAFAPLADIRAMQHTYLTVRLFSS